MARWTCTLYYVDTFWVMRYRDARRCPGHGLWHVICVTETHDGVQDMACDTLYVLQRRTTVSRTWPVTRSSRSPRSVGAISCRFRSGKWCRSLRRYWTASTRSSAICSHSRYAGQHAIYPADGSYVTFLYSLFFSDLGCSTLQFDCVFAAFSIKFIRLTTRKFFWKVVINLNFCRS